MNCQLIIIEIRAHWNCEKNEEAGMCYIIDFKNVLI